ncbi:MAG TPA: PfkB family carbohydrate kinase [Myxococcota bacterium]|jgi:fructokinase|nr:PfkB family carbohydrate kinase [Myxococcota bacterium]
MNAAPDAAGGAPEVVCVGEALVDLFPADEGARGKALRDIARFERHGGGAPANTAVGLARLGVRAALCVMLGDDEFGHFLHESLQREGVMLLARWTRAARTGLAFVGWDAHGDRRFLFYRSPGADDFLDGEAVEAAGAAIRGARLLHLCTNTLIRDPARGAHRRAMEIAAAAGVPIACDLNLRVHLWPGGASEAYGAAREMAAAATVLKADRAEAEALTGEADPVAAARALAAAADGRRTRLACVTLGAAGAAWAVRDGAAGLVPAPAVAVADTTGAGDAFSAALGAGLLRRGRSGGSARGGIAAALGAGEAEALVAAAVRAGSAAVTRVGATAGMVRSLT